MTPIDWQTPLYIVAAVAVVIVVIVIIRKSLQGHEWKKFMDTTGDSD